MEQRVAAIQFAVDKYFVCSIHPGNKKIKCDLYNYALLVPVLNTNVLEQVDVVRDFDCLLSLIGTFLLLARYVPNVAKRSI